MNKIIYSNSDCCDNSHKRILYIRIALISILTCIIIHSFTGEMIPYHDGLGWDGVAFFRIIRDFHNLFFSHGIDQYYMSRFFPFAVIHYALRLCSIPITIESALIGAKIFNGFMLILLIVYFYKMSVLLKWSVQTEIVAFSFVFFNFPVLKLFGYYPIATDCTALLLAYAGVFYYLSNNLYKLVAVGLIALLTFPFVSVVLLILTLFPRNFVEPITKNSEDSFSKCFSFIVRFLFCITPLLFFMLRVYLHRLDVSQMFITIRGYSGYVVSCISLLAVVSFYYLSTFPLIINWRQLFASFFLKTHFLKILIGICCFFLLYKLLSFVGSPTVRFNLYSQFVGMHVYSQSDIFIFLETPFFYLGLFPLLVMLSWFHIFEFVKKEFGVGYFLVVILFLIMVMDIETRKLVAFYPVLLVPLINFIQSITLKKQVVFVIPFVCLLTSFFWFNINTPDIKNAFEQPQTYVNFPAQRYFMFFGPWQSHSVYLVTIIIEILLGSLIYVLYKRGMLTNRNV